MGIIEQNTPEEHYCFEEYCKKYHNVDKFYKRIPIRRDVTKIMAEPERTSCPHYDQVRFLAFHNKAAKGPGFSRTMIRKILANEEYCMQTDAHMKFTKNWGNEQKQKTT